jgi:hypothetical protein
VSGSSPRFRSIDGNYTAVTGLANTLPVPLSLKFIETIPVVMCHCRATVMSARAAVPSPHLRQVATAPRSLMNVRRRKLARDEARVRHRE